MPRPVKQRRVCGMPAASSFGPCNTDAVEAVMMTVDEYETIRLIDYLGLTQAECAKQMDVARTTVQAIYDMARKKMAEVLVEGKSLLIQGGCYSLCDDAGHCCKRNCPGRGRKPSCQNQTAKCPACRR